MRIPLVRQKFNHTCGVACVEMLMLYYGKNVRRDILTKKMKTTRKRGTARQAIVATLREYGITCTEWKGNWSDIVQATNRREPILINCRDPASGEGHYAIVKGVVGTAAIINDPLHTSPVRLQKNDLAQCWYGHHTRDPKKGWMLIGMKK